MGRLKLELLFPAQNSETHITKKKANVLKLRVSEICQRRDLFALRQFSGGFSLVFIVLLNKNE